MSLSVGRKDNTFRLLKFTELNKYEEAKEEREGKRKKEEKKGKRKQRKRRGGCGRERRLFSSFSSPYTYLLAQPAFNLLLLTTFSRFLLSFPFLSFPILSLFLSFQPL